MFKFVILLLAFGLCCATKSIDDEYDENMKFDCYPERGRVDSCREVDFKPNSVHSIDMNSPCKFQILFEFLLKLLNLSDRKVQNFGSFKCPSLFGFIFDRRFLRDSLQGGRKSLAVIFQNTQHILNDIIGQELMFSIDSPMVDKAGNNSKVSHSARFPKFFGAQLEILNLFCQNLPKSINNPLGRTIL